MQRGLTRGDLKSEKDQRYTRGKKEGPRRELWGTPHTQQC